MQVKAYVFSAVIMLAINACSRDYSPPPTASGEKIFQEACAECHKADNKDNPGMIFALTAANANPTSIAQKIHTGSWKMPNFPNINAESMSKLSDYVLTHNLKN